MWRFEDSPVVSLQKVLLRTGFWVFGFCLELWPCEVRKAGVHDLKACSIKGRLEGKWKAEEQRPDQMRCHWEDQGKHAQIRSQGGGGTQKDWRSKMKMKVKGTNLPSHKTQEKARQVEPGSIGCPCTWAVSPSSQRLHSTHPCTVPKAE